MRQFRYETVKGVVLAGRSCQHAYSEKKRLLDYYYQYGRYEEACKPRLRVEQSYPFVFYRHRGCFLLTFRKSLEVVLFYFRSHFQRYVRQRHEHGLVKQKAAHVAIQRYMALTSQSYVAGKVGRDVYYSVCFFSGQQFPGVVHVGSPVCYPDIGCAVHTTGEIAALRR